MGLWVYSQDKEALMKINDGILYHETDNRNCIVVKESPSYYHIIGEYKTKERALEVLGEIKNILKPIYKVTSEFKKSELTGNCQWIENQKYIPIQTKIYEMPKE